MCLDLEDWLGKHVFAIGEYEPSTSALACKVVRPGMTVVDVGANVGYFTLLFASLVGPHGKVYAFEPIPRVRQALRRNVEMNRAQQVVIRPEALGNDSGESVMWEGPSDHVGISSRRPIPKNRVAREWTVSTARLDELLSSEGRVDLIKIDVEGFEFDVLKGSREILRKQHPSLIVEVTDQFLGERGYSARDLFSCLLELGYSASKITWRGLAEWRIDDQLPPQFNAFFRYENSSPSRFQPDLVF
jgi:FkbM family methyltransferase